MKQYVHISDMNAFLQCRRAWDLGSNLRQHLTTIKPYEPFYFGTVMHRFLEYHYGERLNGDSLGKVISDLEAIPGSIPEFIEFAANLYNHYMQWMNNEKGDLSDCNFESLAVEKSFNMPIYTPTGNPSSKFRFAGKRDGDFRSKIDGKIYLHEIKTTSSIDGRLAQLQFEYQPTAYMLSAEYDYQEPIAGVIYTLIRKKLPADPDVLKTGGLSINKGIDTTADHYLAAIKKQHPNKSSDWIKEYYGGILSILLNQPNRFFRRVLIKRSDAQLAEMRRVLYDVARDMTNKHIPIYHNPGYFCGNCIFQAPCVALSHGQPIDPILNAHYQRNTRLD